MRALASGPERVAIALIAATALKTSGQVTSGRTAPSAWARARSPYPASIISAHGTPSGEPSLVTASSIAAGRPWYAAFVIRSGRIERPLLDVCLYRNRAYAASSLVNFAIFLARAESRPAGGTAPARQADAPGHQAGSAVPGRTEEPAATGTTATRSPAS
jgi:hypothetical protein